MSEPLSDFEDGQKWLRARQDKMPNPYSWKFRVGRIFTFFQYFVQQSFPVPEKMLHLYLIKCLIYSPKPKQYANPKLQMNTVRHDSEMLQMLKRLRI